MFDFFAMANNYEDRKIGRYEEGDLLVSTAWINDAAKPYETAVGHPLYNDGKLIIVEGYDTEDEAREGHQRWITVMTTEPLPKSLRDVSQTVFALLLDMVDDWRDKRRK